MLPAGPTRRERAIRRLLGAGCDSPPDQGPFCHAKARNTPLPQCSYGLGSRRSAQDDRHRQLLKLILRGGFMQVVQVRVCDQVLLKLLRHDAREE